MERERILAFFQKIQPDVELEIRFEDAPQGFLSNKFDPKLSLSTFMHVLSIIERWPDVTPLPVETSKCSYYQHKHIPSNQVRIVHQQNGSALCMQKTRIGLLGK